MPEGTAPPKLGLLGWPLLSSLSPLIHGIFLAEAGLPGTYGLYPVEPSGLAGRIRTLAGEGLRGLNVTFPHKRAAAGLCDRLVGAARTTGVVNTLVFGPGGVSGHNTDPCGFLAAVALLGLEGPYLVAGGGGAALAVDAALRESGSEVVVFCRDPSAWTGTAPARALEALDGAAAALHRGTMVNATPLGWADGDGFPADPASLRGLAFLDLNYDPRWRWRSGLAGIASSVHTGETMLVFQAAESFRLWTGRSPSTAAALAAVRAWMTDPGGADS